MKIYTKKPVTVEAVQWDGTEEGFERIYKWLDLPDHLLLEHHNDEPHISIIQFDKKEYYVKGDWIVRQSPYIFYGVEEDIFDFEYEDCEQEKK